MSCRVLLVALSACAVFMPNVPPAVAGQNGPACWERVGRVAVYDAPRRARYPSIAKAADGTLLVLLTQQTAEQEAAGGGDLLLVRSSDDGKTWSPPQVVYQGKDCEPRAVGTMTALAHGRIIAPFAEMRDAQATCAVRILTSGDGGQSWQASDPAVTLPLAWWAPCGKMIETAGGTLVMPVYGALSRADLKATIHNCGLLRSRDGGKTWGDFTWIAKGPGAVVGAAPATRFSFESPVVQPLADGRWLAMIAARRLNKAGNGPTIANEGPGVPQLLCRLWSSDRGRTWSKPDQLTPGASPALAAVGKFTICANTSWNAYGNMLLLVSHDGFESLHQQVRMTIRGWLRGRTNRPQEMPLPPTVPHLAQKWMFAPYGFPSALPLDENNLVVVFNRSQRGEAQIEGPQTRKIPYEKECIHAVFYRRTPMKGDLAEPPAKKAPDPSGRWVLVDRITVPVHGVLAQMPCGDLVGPVDGKFSRSSDGGRTWQEVEGAKFPGETSALSSAFSVLRSGRWLIGVRKNNKPGARRTHLTTQMGMRGGYPIFKERGHFLDWSVVVSHSDDEGKTWHEGEPTKGPLKWACPATWHFIERPDGTVWLPLYGCVTDEEVDSYSGSNCIIRSGDGGKTWGDPTFIFRTNPRGPDDFQPEPRFSEMDIVQVPNGHLVAFSRCEYAVKGPRGYGATELSVSTDSGRTWRRTGANLVGVSQQTGVVLPDGGIAFTYRSHSWQQPGVAVSYDEGRSFRYLLGGPYETINAFMTAEKEFVVFSAVSHRSDASAGVYRWLPHKR